MARVTPPGTFVKDCSGNESMTRWYVIHDTQNVTLARNLGYLSIGHGYYLEDANEVNNNLYSNLGIFARAAVANSQNPREIPGILAAPRGSTFLTSLTTITRRCSGSQTDGTISRATWRPARVPVEPVIGWYRPLT
jgi:hypothetical protein